jgi:predicted metal-dependent hydrolase
VHRRGLRGTVSVGQDEGGDRLLCIPGDTPHVARRVRDFLKAQAKHDLEAASRCAADALGVPLKRVSVRDQSSRWGSCSSTGVLSYSWRLIMAPSFVLNYLAVHEVAHLVEMNHSRRFWQLVDRLCPDAARAKVWLEVHGADLHRYGMQARDLSPHSAARF